MQVSMTMEEYEQLKLAEAQRDQAWAELREIGKAIGADPEESALDEVRRVVYELEQMRVKYMAVDAQVTVLVEDIRLIRATLAAKKE